MGTGPRLPIAWNAWHREMILDQVQFERRHLNGLTSGGRIFSPHRRIHPAEVIPYNWDAKKKMLLRRKMKTWSRKLDDFEYF